MAAQNLFQQYMQPARSVMDYAADYDAQDMRREQLGAARRTNALADLTAEQTRQTMADTQRSNALIKAAYSQPDVIKALRATGDRAAIDLADKQETQTMTRGKTEAETVKLRAEAAAKEADAKHEAAMRLAQKIPMIRTPEDLQAYEAEGIALGIFPPQAQGRSMQKAQELGGIEQWKALAAQSAVPVVERFKADADMKRAQLAADTSIKTTGMTNATSVENNKRTVGASLANATATRDAAAITAKGNTDAAKLRRDQDTEMKLADDYRAQSKEFGQAQSAHKQLSATLDSATTSPAATLAAATKFMKILDPGSVVRESELGMALAASGVLDRAMNYVSTLQSGQKLTPTQAKDFKNISDKMFVAAQQVQQGIDMDYKTKAKTYGLRPEMVVQDLGQNAKVVSFGDLK